MFRSIPTAVLATLLVAAPSSATAQAAGPARSKFESWAPPKTETRHDPMSWLLGDGSADHRYPGFYVGAATGVVFGFLMLGFCSDRDSTDGCAPATYVLGPLLSGALLGGFGALIGGAIDK